MEMRRMGNNGKGQSAIIDALLFFFIMILVSLFLDHTSFTDVGEIDISEGEIKFTRDAFDSLMKCTVNATNYTKIIGGKNTNVELIHENVLELLLEDLSIKAREDGVDNNSIEKGMERAVKDILANLTSYTFSNRTQVRLYHYYLSGETNGRDRRTRLVLSDMFEKMDDEPKGLLPVEKYSFQQHWDMPDGVGKARFTLFLWRA